MMLHHTTLYRLAFSILLALALAACGGRKSTDALDAARDAVLGAEGSERCAEAEFRAARNLLEQANAAYEARDFARARQLAEAATIQAERARQVAEANAEDCDRVDAIEETLNNNNNINPNVAPLVPVDTDYDLVAVFFEFDQSSLTDEARNTLERHAAFLNANNDLRLIVQGHCDELGSSEYNLVLGEARARTVVAYLVRLGVAANRLQTVSFGEEMTLSSTDQSRNRRAEFVARY